MRQPGEGGGGGKEGRAGFSLCKALILRQDVATAWVSAVLQVSLSKLWRNRVQCVNKKG